MIGVAQVIGTKPTFSLVFSSLPRDSFTAALAFSIGNTLPRTAAAVPAPIIFMKLRRLCSL